MTTYSTISNGSVAVGAIPSSVTVTALRDNPIAMAEAASGAPINRAGWHPVDKVTVGDGLQGVIYDFSVSGAVSSIVTPDFEDGYEYRLVGSNLGFDGSVTLLVDFYEATAAAYANARTTASISSASTFDLDIEFITPRAISRGHVARYTNLISVGGSPTATIDTVYGIGVSNSTAQKLLRARIRPSSGNFDSGKVWFMRRREFMTAD